MGSRFDEVELLTVAASAVVPAATGEAPRPVEGVSTALEPSGAAPRLKRMSSLVIDLSLFAASALALAPLFPLAIDPAEWHSRDLVTVAGIAGFLLLLSYYYFTVCWLFWGKTIGGAIFDVRVVSATPAPLNARRASMRWVATIMSLLCGGIGFLSALLPRGRSFADRLSGTISVRS